MFWRVVIAIVVGWLLWKTMTSIIRMLADAPDEPDPTDVSDAEVHFRCSECGTEVIMTVQSNTEDAFPRHCREPMNPIWRPV